MSPPTIVVPLDGSLRALAALPIASRLAELEGATVHLVHVTRDVSPPAEILERMGVADTELRGLVLHTNVGEPAPKIASVAREVGAIFIVLCTHTAGAADERIVGGTALGVLERAPCPVVLVRPDRGLVRWHLRRILLPHDGTPATTAAIGPAADLAHRSHAALDVLHVARDRARPPAERGTMTAPRYVDQPQHEWPAWIEEFVSRLETVHPLESLEVSMALGEGTPSTETLRVAAERDSDLIVLAWRGEWEGAHAATVKAVLRGAPCPVMVTRVRAPERDSSIGRDQAAAPARS